LIPFILFFSLLNHSGETALGDNIPQLGWQKIFVIPGEIEVILDSHE
jgi:hypothetical protein